MIASLRARQIDTSSSNSCQQILLSGTIMTALLCWVIGTPTKQTFPVEIEPDKLWGNVKDAIKKEKEPAFDDIAAEGASLRY